MYSSRFWYIRNGICIIIDEVTSDNNDEVLQRLIELEKILKKIQNGTT